MKTPALIAIAAVAALTSACTTMGGGRAAPVDATRYHLSQPIPAGTIAIEGVPGEAMGPEYQLYADAVASELARMNFTPAPAGQKTDYLATVAFRRTEKGQIRTRPPLTIGLGGGSYGGGVGLGGGASVGIGSKTRTVYGTELAVQMRRRGDNTVIWEGRAVTEAIGGQAGAQPDPTASRLAMALFKGFPGQSGITITVK
ncbi:DUF4136 domain-containing protein [Sphingomonas sp.]|uniref:DUF4136 domain-containing protein n=1 Tax=Sphingomonas sp. TaxID=28214 RepID=UPI001EC987D2|nr:DUF4136 domain-containing protein [Sphingomonas sp.]MBX3594532.1 DUF4136 domain-containing protein [Sphingomonas sp.]